MISALLAAGILFAQAAPAATPADTAAAADPAKPPEAGKVVSPLTVTPGKPKPVEETRVICHKEPVMGSLFPKEVCATKREAAERRQNDQEQVRQWTALRPYRVN